MKAWVCLSSCTEYVLDPSSEGREEKEAMLELCFRNVLPSLIVLYVMQLMESETPLRIEHCSVDHKIKKNPK